MNIPGRAPLDETHGLLLETCPEPVQVMPPQAPVVETIRIKEIIGNALILVLLMGGLLSIPYWIASFLAY